MKENSYCTSTFNFFLCEFVLSYIINTRIKINGDSGESVGRLHIEAQGKDHGSQTAHVRPYRNIFRPFCGHYRCTVRSSLSWKHSLDNFIKSDNYRIFRIIIWRPNGDCCCLATFIK